MRKHIISTDKAPAAIGPYSQAVKVGNMVFTSGQIPVNPSTGELVKGGIDVQARQIFENLAAVLEAAGTGFEHVIKATVFIKDMNDFAEVNKIYQEYIPTPYPARSCVEVSRLPKDVGVEIEMVAIIPE